VCLHRRELRLLVHVQDCRPVAKAIALNPKAQASSLNKEFPTKTTPKEPYKKHTIWLSGRIGEYIGRQYPRTLPHPETFLLLPPPDNYTAPKRLSVRANSKLGTQDEDIPIEVEPVLRPWLNKNLKWQYPLHLIAVKPS
jgi:hypothetical protein